MAADGQTAATKYACKCLNIRIHVQPTQSTPPLTEAGFNAVYVGEEGIHVAHTEVTLRSRSKPVPDPDSPSGELTRYTTVTCLVCGVPTYRVLQRITPDLINEIGPVLPTDDWVEKELVKSTTGWIEVYQGCISEDEISQAESSPMYSSMFAIVLPGPRPPAETAFDKEDGTAGLPDARGPSEQNKRHLPELPPLFLPPPFTPSHIAFSHFSSLATERSQKLRDEAEEYIAQITQQKVAEIRRAEAVMKEEVNLVWSKFREAVRLIDETGSLSGAGLPLRRRASVSGHPRAVSTPAPGTAASVRISSFVPTPSPPPRNPVNNRPPAQSALSASLKTSGFHHPDAQKQVNGSTPAARRSLDFGLPDRARASPSQSSARRVQSPSTASTRTAAVPIDPEASIREAYRREMDESKDVATSFRYVMDLEAQMEEARLLEEAELASAPGPLASQAVVEASTTSVSRGRSPRVQKSAVKHTQPSEDQSGDGAAKAVNAEENKDGGGKGKRKVTFDVKPEVAIIKDNAENRTKFKKLLTLHIPDPIFDMDNETDRGTNARADAPAEPPKATPASSERVRVPPRSSRKSSSSNPGLPPMLSSLWPASLPALSAMRPPVRHSSAPVMEPSERPRNLRESLLAAEANSLRPDAVETPLEIQSMRNEDEEGSTDPREAEILRLVAASTPSHRSAWKKNSKAWQLFLSRRERRATEVGPEPISEEGSYASVDDFDSQTRRAFNGIADSDVTDEEDGGKTLSALRHISIRLIVNWADDPPIAQSLPIPIGPLGQHGQSFSIPSYQPKTSLSDRPGVLVPALRSGSSASLRRASYAERDRVRPIDPGALDFAVDEDAEEEDVESDPETGGKARQRALKILQAREDMPAAGE
ncbi:hypothetical protein BD414DRAFT_544282 [Trametes punicea]|nr:hypothetical protein BD414DRAFT_544282 [Trametes punicea]